MNSAWNTLILQLKLKLDKSQHTMLPIIHMLEKVKETTEEATIVAEEGIINLVEEDAFTAKCVTNLAMELLSAITSLIKVSRGLNS